MKSTYKYLLFISSVGFSRFIAGVASNFVIAIFPPIISELYNQSSSNATNGTSTDTFDYGKLGLLFAAKGITCFVFSPISGILIDICTPLKVFLTGLILRCITLVLFAFGNQYYLLIISRLIEGCAMASVNCSIDSLISFKFKGHSILGYLYGVYYVFFFLGASVGPTIGGYMFETYGRVPPFLLVLAMTASEAIVTLAIMLKRTPKTVVIKIESSVDILSTNGSALIGKEIVAENEEPNERFLSENSGKVPTPLSSERDSMVDIIGRFLSDPYVYLFFFAQFITATARFSYFSILPRHMLLQFRVSEFKQGSVYILNIVGYGVGFIVGGLLNMKFKSYRYVILIILAFFNGVTIMIFPFLPTWWSISFPLCFLAFFNIIFDIIMSPICTSITEKRHQGKYGIMSGLKMMNIALVITIAQLIAPILYQHIGFIWLSVILTLLNVLYGPLYYFLRIFT